MSEKNEVLTYKGHPLMRKDNLVYYGSMADEFIVMLQILETKKLDDLELATKVSVQLQRTDPAAKARDRVVKKTEKDGFYKEMGLYPRLAAHNQVVWHWEGGALRDAVLTDVYITSANALAETGEIVNIDGNGNRVSSTLYGHQKVYFLVGVNKVAPDFEAALWRARNVAAPKRAQSMGCRTPCAAKADRCYDCKSPERICRGLAVLWARPNATEEMEVVLIGEALGM